MLKSSKVRIAWGAVLVLMAAAILCAAKAGTWLVKRDPPLHSDAMVMLMGGVAPDRILETADLFEKGMAAKVIIVQENRGAYRELEARGAHILSNSVQAASALADLGVPRDSILILPGDARSTQAEAIIVREYLKHHPSVDSITLITSTDHSRRAFMIFSKAFRKAGLPVVVISNPSSYSSFAPNQWWKHKEDAQAVFMEYLKLMDFWLVDSGKL